MIILVIIIIALIIVTFLIAYLTRDNDNAHVASIICYILSIAWVIGYIIGSANLNDESFSLLFGMGFAIIGLLIDIRSSLIRLRVPKSNDINDTKTNNPPIKSDTPPINGDTSKEKSSDNTPDPVNKATVKCPDCGTEYDPVLNTCPKCGCPNDSKK